MIIGIIIAAELKLFLVSEEELDSELHTLVEPIAERIFSIYFSVNYRFTHFYESVFIFVIKLL